MGMAPESSYQNSVPAKKSGLVLSQRTVQITVKLGVWQNRKSKVRITAKVAAIALERSNQEPAPTELLMVFNLSITAYVKEAGQ
nr:hypothetical protein Iba_chr14bCG13150 [Ipomoea batatas]